MDTMEDRAGSLVKNASTHYSYNSYDDYAADSLSPWRRFMTNAWAFNTILFGGTALLQVLAWTGLNNSGALANGDVAGAGPIAAVVGLIVFGIVWMFGVAASFLEGIGADLAFNLFAKPEGSSSMQWLRYQVAEAVRSIKNAKGRSVSRAEISSKLKEARKAAQAEEFAVKLIAAQLVTSDAACNAESFIRGGAIQEETLALMSEADQALMGEAVETARTCRMEVARLVVALQDVARAEEKNVEARKERQVAEKKLGEVRRQQAFLDKKRMRLAEAPRISTDTLVEHAALTKERVLADKEAAAEMRKLAEG